MGTSVSPSQRHTHGGDQNSSPGRVCVTLEDGDRFVITTRGHEMLVDQPVAEGGQNSAATPTELFIASMASCIAFYAGRYLRRHELDAAGVSVLAEVAMSGDKPAPVGSGRAAV